MEQDTEQLNFYGAQVDHGQVLELVNSIKVDEPKRPNSFETVTSTYQKEKIKRMKITHEDSSSSTENTVHKNISCDTISPLLTQAEPIHLENQDNAPTGVDIDPFAAGAVRSPTNGVQLMVSIFNDEHFSTGSNFINKAMSLLEIAIKHLQEGNDHLKAEVEDLKKQLIAERAEAKTELEETAQLHVQLMNERVKFEKEMQAEIDRLKKKYSDLKTAKKAKELDESKNHTNQFKLKSPQENNASSAKKFEQLEVQIEELKKQSSELQNRNWMLENKLVFQICKSETELEEKYQLMAEMEQLKQWCYELKTNMHTNGSDVCRFDDHQKEEYRAFANSIVGWINGLRKEKDELFHIVNNLQEMIAEAILGEPTDTLPEPRWMTEQTQAWQEGYNHGYFEGWLVGFRQFGHWINESLPSHWRHN